MAKGKERVRRREKKRKEKERKKAKKDKALCAALLGSKGEL